MSNQKNISNDSPCITKVSEGFTPNNPTSQQAIALHCSCKTTDTRRPTEKDGSNPPNKSP